MRITLPLSAGAIGTGISTGPISGAGWSGPADLTTNTSGFLNPGPGGLPTLAIYGTFGTSGGLLGDTLSLSSTSFDLQTGSPEPGTWPLGSGAFAAGFAAWNWRRRQAAGMR